MITNLLGKYVWHTETNVFGEVCAINENFKVAFASEDGVIHVSDMASLKMEEGRKYYVEFSWDNTNKAAALRTVVELKGLNLSGAKEFVERSHTIIAKENLKYQEAVDLKDKLEFKGFKVRIGRLY